MQKYFKVEKYKVLEIIGSFGGQIVCTGIC